MACITSRVMWLRERSDLHIQNVELHPDILLVLSVHLDAVDVAEVCQQCHQVGLGVDDVADAIPGPDQQGHFCVFLSLLQWQSTGSHFRRKTKKKYLVGVWMSRFWPDFFFYCDYWFVISPRIDLPVERIWTPGLHTVSSHWDTSGSALLPAMPSAGGGN